jgi:hypothetical protein
MTNLSLIFEVLGLNEAKNVFLVDWLLINVQNFSLVDICVPFALKKRSWKPGPSLRPTLGGWGSYFRCFGFKNSAQSTGSFFRIIFWDFWTILRVDTQALRGFLFKEILSIWLGDYSHII